MNANVEKKNGRGRNPAVEASPLETAPDHGTAGLGDRLGPEPLMVTVTEFPNVTPKTCERKSLSWDELCARFADPKTYPEKRKCRLLIGALLGDKPTENGCIRHEANVQAYTVLFGDYDAGVLTIPDAATMLAGAGVEAMFYTSASHTAEQPRWRVVAPLSKAIPPAEFPAMMGRLNGVLGGALARESFTVSQSYYIGRVNGAVYETQRVRGQCIDLLPGLEAGAVYPPPKAPAAPVVGDFAVIPAIPQRFHDLLQTDEKLRRRWEGDPEGLEDQSGSGFDASLTAILVHRKFSDAEIFAVLKVYPHGKAKGRSDDYLARTIIHAREFVSAHAVDVPPGLQTNHRGNFLITLPNVVAVAKSRLDRRRQTLYRSRFHERLMLIETVGGRTITRDVVDGDVRELWSEVQRIGQGFDKVGWDLMWHVVEKIGAANARDEVEEWLDGVKWDGVPRLDALCEVAFGTTRTEYHSKLFKNMLLACVARQYQPGTKFDHAVVLVSGQGVKKTWTLEALFGADQVACVPKDPTTKDSMMLTLGKLCVELDEMSAVRKTQLEELKSWVTRRADEYRDPYGRLTQRHPRRFVIVGTTNSREFLEDEENRRWWPVDVEAIDMDYLQRERDQLFAEAVVLYRDGYEFWEIPKDEALAAQEKRRLRHPWVSQLEQYIAEGKEVRVKSEDGGYEDTVMEFPTGFVSTADLLGKWLNVQAGSMNTSHTKILAAAMRELGYEKAKSEGFHNGLSGWVPKTWVWDPVDRAWGDPACEM